MPTQSWREANREKVQKHQREWYVRNKVKQRNWVLKRRAELKDWLVEYKSTLACQQCGESHPACLDFHHLDPKQKEVALSRVIEVKGWKKERILEEIAKCQVLCANCHRKEHWKMRISNHI